jgi:hypothetical protein
MSRVSAVPAVCAVPSGKEFMRASVVLVSRYDSTGLVWLLQGQPVIALTGSTAAIQNTTTGNITIYRKANKPAYGPVGNSLDDFV